MADEASKLKEKVGLELEAAVCEIEKGTLRRFAQALGDPNPLWQDEEYAVKTRYGGIIAPPTLALTLGFSRIQQMLTLDPSLTVLHGSTELEPYQPIRPGDVVTVSTRIARVRERPGKMGSTLFVTFEVTCRNQRQEMVARCRQMAIIY